MDKIENNILCYDDVALIPRHSYLKGRNDCDVSIEFLGEKYRMPIILAPMTCLTTPEMVYMFWKNGLVPTVHRYFNSFEEQYDYMYFGLSKIYAGKRDNDDNLYHILPNDEKWKIVVDYHSLESTIKPIMDSIYWSVGGIKKHKDWLDDMLKSGITKFIVDVANGNTEECEETCSYIRKECVEAKIISGNYADFDGFNNCCSNAFRMGIGGGSCCTTAKNTGFYYPSLQAVKNASEHCTNERYKFIADGGIKSAGDIAKAMAFGADMVMCGYLFAGTSCASGISLNEKKEPVYAGYHAVKWKTFCGMASRESKKGTDIPTGSIEGTYGYVPYAGTTQEMISMLYENLKSSLAYCGAKDWTEFYAKVKYFMVSPNENKEQNERVFPL